ncbi:MAG TPA: helix-turn-helix domain-containing protein [Candidatus Limnocylindria bacterium]
MNERPYRQRERARSRARTRAAIEAATLRESAKRGYAGLRMTDVARRAKVAPRTVYLHAPSKERLVHAALRRRADAIVRRVERWQPRAESPEGILNDLVALHERTYRAESATLETLTSGGVPRDVAEILRDLDDVRLALITRTLDGLARRRVLRVRAAEGIALAHALLAYPTWRTALTGPAGRSAPRFVANALRSALL